MSQGTLLKRAEVIEDSQMEPLPTTEEATKPAFHRFFLSKQLRILPTTIPPQVDSETWRQFWDSFRPLINSVQGKNEILLTVLNILYAALFLAALVLVILFAKREETSHTPLIYIAILFSTFFLSYLHSMITGYVKVYYLNKLQSTCQEWQPQFPSYALECRLMVGILENRPSGYYLYLVPLNNGVTHIHLDTNDEMVYQYGYLRIETTRDNLWCGGPKTPPMYSLSDYVPAGMETISTSDWSDFWSKLHQITNDRMSCNRKRWLAIVGFYVALFGVLCMDSTWVIVIIGLFCVQILLLAAQCSYQSEYNRLTMEQKEHIQKFVQIFKSQQVCMEYCQVTTRHWLFGALARQYLYFYPIQTN